MSESYEDIYKEMPRCQECERTAFDLFEGLCWECAEAAADERAERRAEAAEAGDTDYARDTARDFHEEEWEAHTIKLVDFGGRDPSQGG